MSNNKISQLTSATTPLAGTETLPIVQSSTTKQVSVANLTAGRAVSADSLALTNALPATSGGTGQSSYAVGDILYASTTTALSRLADVATGNALISGGIGVAPSWGKVGLTTHVSGTLAVGNGGTGLTTLAAGYIPYGNGTSAFSSTSNLYYGGKNMGLGTSSPVDFGSGYTVLSVNDTTGGGVAFLAAATQKGSIFNAGNAMYIDCNNSAGILNIRNTATGATSQFGATGIVTLGAYGAGAATFSAAGVISSVSDETWKVKDGAPVDVDAMLNKLKPGYWYYNDEKKDTFGADRQLGFYAQNVNAAIGPEAAPEPETVVTKNNDGTETSVTKPWGYYDRSVLAVTVMSLQKALATIELLKIRLAALENK